MSDDPTGFDRAPDRYSQRGRETIDLIRDAMTDDQFIGFCVGNAIKYKDRAGHKEGQPAEQDIKKAVWYMRMAEHVKFPGAYPDPRCGRTTYVPYVRRPPSLELPIAGGF